MRGKRKWRSHVASVPQQILFEVLDSLAQVRRFYLGVYMPELSSQNVGLIHKLWVSVTNQPGAEDVHHRDMVAAGLRLLEQDLI